jgi:hypothetical protein
MTFAGRFAAVTLLILGPGIQAHAQTFDGPGARAEGMGAFVAVADDASAVYWNPAGLASGAYFSLLMDRTSAETVAIPPSGGQFDAGASRSSWLLALASPALGVSYYRLRSTVVAPVPTAAHGLLRVESLVTHHTGGTLVQSIVQGLAVGATVKLVRGVATVGHASGTAEDLLDDWDLLGAASNRFDVDLGVMATTTLVRAGLTVRNVLEPEFDAAEGQALRLDRQARAGVALLLTERWTAAADVDLTRNRGPYGDVRTLALGAEGRLSMRAIARAGVRLNTAGDAGRTPVATFGGSYAAFGSLLVDAHFSAGSDHGFGGWGVAGRVVF